MIALTIAIFANWLRIIIIIVVGTYTEMNHFIVRDHLTFGWIVFAICLLPLIYIARTYFNGTEVQNDGKDEQLVTGSSASQVVNKTQIITTFAVLTLFVSASYWIPSRFDENYALSVPKLKNYQMMSSEKSYSPNWKPYSQGANKERFFYYTKDKLGFQVYLADYIRQQQASEMIYVENYLFDKQFWHQIDDKNLLLSSSKNLQAANLVILQRSQYQYRMIASWYVINGVLTSDKKRAKLAEVKAALIGKPGATLVAVTVDFDGQDQVAAEKQLSEFVYSYLNPS